ncbi:41533_t:CDS:2, partial [Gigaspora margarita]
DINYTETKSSDHFDYKSSTSTLPAPPEIYGISFPTGTHVIPGLLPGMTAIPTATGQDFAAENAKLFALDSQNPSREVEGALIETNFKSTIGVLLDDFSESFGIREKVANYYLGQNNDFWLKKAQIQTKFTEHRQTHRAYYYFNKKQLPIPPEQVWEFNLSKAYRTKIGDHDYIAVDVDFYSVLAKNINRSEPVLNINGGKWSGKTGYACVSRKSSTIDSENIWAYYNDFCETKQTQPTSEHPAICCVDELNQNVGSVNAKNYRFGNHTSTLSDLAGVHKDLLEETRVAYRYYGRNSCELHEQCIGAPGWRRLLRFTTTSLNSGKADIHIGNVTNYLFHGIFEWDNCQNIFNAIQWELTNFTTSYGYPVSRAKCNFINSWDANNYESINYILHKNSSFVTEPCTRSQSGPLRDCGFQVQNNAIECIPGENGTLGFYLRESKQTPSAFVNLLGYWVVLPIVTNTIVELSSSESNPAKVTFQCQIGRDYIETGGLYAILVAPTFI